jgi:capsular polysaccharide export protein
MDGDPRNLPRFLFLQGMATPFLSQLGAALFKRGHVVRRINFTAGDRLFWRLPGAVDYRGDLAAWPTFLDARLREWGISDIVLFGDCRPLHKAAIRVASRHGITVHVAEEGYLRPHWVTLAAGGVNGHSALPRDPAWFRKEAAQLPAWDGGIAVKSSFWRRAAWDIAYHLCAQAFRWYYPGYRSHLAWNPFREYAGWIGRFARWPWSRRQENTAMRTLDSWRSRQRFLFPLQLESDSQILFHSPFKRLTPALDLVLESFARFAPGEARLIVKEHPLDPGLYDWRRATLDAAAKLGIADRVVYIRGKRVEPILQDCAGVVTLNSTVGVLALAAEVPVIALGKAIYDMPGLTFQRGLNRFWNEAARPDAAIFDAFRRVVAHRTQINGGFFSADGLKLAIAGAVERLEGASAMRPIIMPLAVPAGRDTVAIETAPLPLSATI